MGGGGILKSIQTLAIINGFEHSRGTQLEGILYSYE